MSEYLSKKAVLEWLKKEQRDEGWLDQTKHGFFWVEREIESGAFDADDSEVQRLRAALHKITQIYDDPNLHDLTACHEMNRIAKEALSTTTEPTGQNDADDLIGDWIDERCLKCGADLLANKVGDKWCSLVGCDYSINAKERVGTEEWRHKHINAYWAREGLIKHQEAEVQRLRAENERYRKALERIAEIDIPYAPMTDHSVMRFYEQVAREALASTPTEPNKLRRMKR